MKKNPYFTIHIPGILKKLFLLVSMACIITGISAEKAKSQEAYQLQELFMDAEAWFYFQDYKNSLPLYLRVHNAYPENHNVNYKIGFCYLNIDGQKHKAIPYLEKAAENTTFNFSNETFYEKEAPVDAIFYLANAYFIDNQIDKALETYNRFEEKVKNRRTIFRRADFDYEYLQKQKEKCRNAKELMSDPVNYTAENVGLPINTPQPEYNPVISGDGQTMVFTADKKFYTGVFMSKKQNGKWGPPINLLPQLGIDGDCETSSLSYEGDELYLYREDELDGNIYVSYYNDGSWSEIQKLGENINTKYWESHAFISSDGQTLYFSSNREGGYGDLDIYKASRKADGSWGKPENLGKPVNTEWREDTPFLTEDENTLFFSSEGHYNMGGYDIFTSHRTKDGWSEPKNIGYPLNTTDNDRFIVPYNNGKNAYYSRFNKKTGGQKDIYSYNLKELPTIDFIEVEGIMTYQSPDKKIQENFTINVINTRTNDTLAVLEPGKGSEDFAYKTPLGENHLIYETPQLQNNQQYIISKDYSIKEQYLKPKELAEKPKEEPEPEPQINLDSDVFQVGSEKENVKIKLQLKGGNRLVVNTFQQGKLINSEEFSIQEDSFVYEYQPEKEKSRITFNLFDNEENILSRDVDILLDSLKPEDKQTKLDIQEKSVSLASGQKKIKIKLSLEKGSELFVETFVDNKLINTETFNINQEDFTYEFEPEKEKSKINFKVIDENNNIKNQEIVISHKPIEPGLESILKSVDKFALTAISGISGSAAFAGLSTLEILSELELREKKQEITREQLDALLMSAVILKSETPEKLYNDLYRMAEGDLKLLLKSYQNSDFKKNQDVIAILRQAVKKNEIEEQQVRELLNKYIAQTYNPKELRMFLADISEINLNSILQNLGTKAFDIVSVKDLWNHIETTQAEKKEKILAYLETIRILNDKYQPSIEKKPVKPGVVKKEEPKGEKTVQYLVIAFVGIVLILFIIFLIKRRRRNNSKS